MPRVSTSARRALTEERRKQILEAATQVFAAKGYDRATIADVAREAGVAEGSIYNYFKNKADLLISIPRQMIQIPIESVVEQMRLAGTAAIPPERVLRLVAKNMMGMFRQNGHIFRILFSALPALSQRAREEYLNRVVFFVWDILESYFRDLIEKGIFRQDMNSAILTRAFVGMLLPFVLLNQLLPLKEFDDDEILEHVIPVFLQGALAGPGAVLTPMTQPRRAKKIAVE